MPHPRSLSAGTVVQLANKEVGGAKVGDDFIDVIRAACFDHGVDLRKLCRHVIEQALVEDLDDVAAAAADRGGDRRQHARLVRDVDAKSGKASVAGHVPVQDRCQQTRIDIAAADDDANALAGKGRAMLMQRGDARGARTFGNDPLLFDKASDGPFERLFVDQKDIIDEIGDDGARDAARLLDRDALRQRFAAAGDVLAGDGSFIAG